MAQRVATVQDKHGETWTGTVVNKDSVTNLAGRVIDTVLSFGASEILCTPDKSITVRVNGTEHTGTPVK